jgi:hypothetical protein
LELIKDYDLGINYHPSKANVVADVLSRRSHVNTLATRELLPEFCKEFEKLNLGWVSNTEVITIEVDSTLEQDIQKGQLSYPIFMPKRSTHRMHDLGSIVPQIRPKVLIDNQMS